MDAILLIQQYAQYNHWINQRLLEAGGRLSHEELQADLDAYFGSLIETFNHIAVGDSIWLHRFAQADHPAAAKLREADWLPMPAALDQVLANNWADFEALRRQLDALILDWASALTAADLDEVIHYKNTRGRPFRRQLGLLALHFFNHQTHHRGQITNLMFQQGIDPGITDMVQILPEQPPQL